MSDRKSLPAAEPCMSYLLPPCHAAISSSCMLCQLVCPQAQHPVEEGEYSSLGLWTSFLILPLHLATPSLLPCVPFLLLFVLCLLPPPFTLHTASLAYSVSRKPLSSLDSKLLFFFYLVCFPAPAFFLLFPNPPFIFFPSLFSPLPSFIFFFSFYFFWSFCGCFGVLFVCFPSHWHITQALISYTIAGARKVEGR